MKHMNKALSIIACFAIIPAHAKQVGNKTNTNAPKPTPTPYVQPAPTPMPQPTPYYPQQQTGPTYTEIYNSLRKKTPDSSDFSTLNNIIYEAQEQIKRIQKSVEKKPAPQPKPANNTNDKMQIPFMRGYAGKLVDEYQISLNRTSQQIRSAEQDDADLFSISERQQQFINIGAIVAQFIQQYPNADKNSTVNIIYLAITQHKEFVDLSNKLSKKLDQEVREDIKNSIEQSWDNLH